MTPRFEVCRGDDGWHGRFRAANGRILWWTENYKRYRDADRAVAILREGYNASEVRRVDERTNSEVAAV